MKKILFALLCLTMTVLFLPASADAAEESESGSNFSVTCPTSLPIWMDADGNITTSDSLCIRNTGDVPAQISSIDVVTQNGWIIIDYNDDFCIPVGSHEFGMQILGHDIPVDGHCSLDCIVLDSGERLRLSYRAKIPAQDQPVNTTIASVIFTIQPVETESLFDYTDDTVEPTGDLPPMEPSDSDTVDPPTEDTVPPIEIPENIVPDPPAQEEISASVDHDDPEKEDSSDSDEESESEEPISNEEIE